MKTRIPICESFSLYIRCLRERLSLSREHFGEKIGVSSMTIYEWEKGKTFPKMTVLEKVFQSLPSEEWGTFMKTVAYKAFIDTSPFEDIHGED